MTRITSKLRMLAVAGLAVGVRRNSSGVVELAADDELAIAAGMGFAHAYDRLVQMSLFRLIGQGRLTECLKTGADKQRLDIASRMLGLARHAELEVDACAPRTRAMAEAYCQGVNHYLRRESLPFEFQILGYRPEPWTVADTLTVLKLTMYSMAHSQRQMERFLIEAIRRGVSVGKLKRLFAPHLDEMSDDLVENLRQVEIWSPLISGDAPSLLDVGQFAASNNWALAGHRSASGFPIECHDPHLPCNQLPQPWYELVATVGDRYGIGVGVPGVPGFVMGRNNDVSMGFTYGYMDTIDYFIEHVRDGRYLEGDCWREFQVHTETLKQRRARPLELVLHENDRGLLECDPLSPTVSNGYHLCCAWSARKTGAARLLDVIVQSADVRSVVAAQKLLRNASLPANWVLADRSGNIGSQQSGLLPKRRHSGLFPLPGWQAGNAWTGFVDGDRLASNLNPACGLVATANDLHQTAVGPLSINLCMGSDRASRIVELLGAKDQFSLDDMQRMQHDVVSRQAERFMRVLRPLLPPEAPSSAILREWDLRYDQDSLGASLFEDIYAPILAAVFGHRLFGDDAWNCFAQETALLANYFHYFDQCLLGENGPWDETEWFGAAGRESLLRDVLRRVLVPLEPSRLQPWGSRRQVTFENMLLGPRLSRFLGIAYGPVTLAGGRGTISQSVSARSFGQQCAVAPSYRYVTDLGQDSVQTSLAGGASGRPCSRWYLSDMLRWHQGEYKTLAAKSES